MIKAFLLPAILASALSFIYAVQSHPICQFVFDDRPKVLTYYMFCPRLVHIDIECAEPTILWAKDYTDKNYLCYQNINIFFFPTDFTLMYTLGWRYIPLEET